jgi:fatty aldehyde-generating acyl-ACP reductase
MTSAPSTPEFALLGHQESWESIARVVRGLRDPGLPPLPTAELRDLVGWIPPRTVMRNRVLSTTAGRATAGIYVETFITPDELEAVAFHRAVARVREAVTCAAREGARIAALGGFTSIVVEGRGDALGPAPGLALTTGNTLTAAFIVKGVERAAHLTGVDLREATVLVIGASGDIGSGCARHLGRSTRRLLLAARNPERLRREVSALQRSGVAAEACLDVGAAIGRADVVVAAASLARPELDLAACQPDALVCDAGYPKNLCAPDGGPPRRIFWGGMGQVVGGWQHVGGLPLESFYSFPAPHVAHGCLLEAIALALARRFEPYSQGRGWITPERMDELAALAASHGIVPAPLFSGDGLWPEERAPHLEVAP